MKKKTLWIGIGLSLFVIGYVLLKLDWREVSKILLTLNWLWILLAFFFYLLSYFFRTHRFRRLLSFEEIPFHLLYGLTGLYGMYLYLIPAKFGEATFPILVKRRLGINFSTTTGSLIVARIFDFLTIALILPAALFIYWDLVPVNIRLISLFFCVLVYFSYGVFYWLMINPARILHKLEINSSTKPRMKAIKEFLKGVFEGAQQVHKQKLYWPLLLITLCIWVCLNLNSFLITLALGYDFNFFQIVVVSIIMVPVTLFPFQGFANLGAHEVGWVSAFTLFGYPYLEALSIAVSSHIVYVFFVLILGLIGSLAVLDRRNAEQ